MGDKDRLSASVDAELLAAGRRAVDEGDFDNVSSWVNEALRQQSERDRRLRSLRDFVASYEAKHGEISEDEILEVTRRTRAKAVVVRGRRGAA